ncbi:PAS domain S-box protein [Endomicrobium sp. AH-315-J14]|nr:PAS domain S-box protein [Endomicrobium sp. AH-315-J14]
MTHGRTVEGQRKDGTTLPIEIHLSPLKTETHKILASVVDLTTRQGLEAKLLSLQEVQAERARAYQLAPVGLCYLDSELRYTQINEWLATLHGVAAAAHIGRRFCEMPTAATRELEVRIREAIEVGGCVLGCINWVKTQENPDGRWIEHACHVDRSDDGVVLGVSFIVRDITERRNLEEQVVAAQRMEAVGQLAGGVAHDYNNILTVILNFGGFLREECREGDPGRDDIDTIIDAATRAKRLTSQLLAFSRRQVLQLVVGNINDTVEEIGQMLTRLIGEDVLLRTELAEDLGFAKFDISQLEQILMNLPN